MDENLYSDLRSTQSKLDSVSPSMCLAKWLQVTIHLQNGFNHSCHHPDLHKIDIKELEQRPQALHNTAFKKEIWRQMKRGQRPQECDFCWKVEDATDNYSDRTIKSNDHWAKDRFDAVVNKPDDEDINPSYVEVSFGYECNFKCVYCGPNVSSSIWQQYKKHGPFVGRYSLEDIEKQGRKPYRVDEANPYLQAFWKWFPDLSKDLKVFRITGGEPLINPNTFKVLDFIEQNPLPNLELAINSNLGVPDKTIDRFFDGIKRLTDQGKIRKFVLFTSIDSHGRQAEYMRTGLNYEKWYNNVHRYLDELPWDVSFMVTFNIFSVPRFQLFLEDFLRLSELSVSEGKKRTILDITHLSNPQYFSPNLLTRPWHEELHRLEQFMLDHEDSKIGPHGFWRYESLKMKRLKEWVLSHDSESFQSRFFRRRLYTFFHQMKEREGMDFLEYFPEMAEFYQHCLEGAKDIIYDEGP